MKKKFFLYLCFFSVALANAQGDITLYSLRDLQQSTNLNPAFMPAYGLSVGIPVLSNTLVATQLNGFDLHTIMKSIDEGGIINLQSLYSNINDNLIGVKIFVQTDFFHVRKQFGHYQVGIFSGMKTNSNMLLSKEFINFMANGTGNYIGQTMSFSNNDISISSYIETGISVAREFEKFTIGARVKMLNGIANISTNNLALNFFTSASPVDPIRLSLGGTMNSSGLPYQQDSINGKINDDRDISRQNINPLNNRGFAVDLGATYHVTPRLNVQASAIDLGGITWKNHTYNYNLNNVDITYLGLTFNQYRQFSGTDSAARKSFNDSLKNFIKTSSTSSSYYTPLVSRFIIGADYNLTLRNRIGVMMQMQYFGETFFPSYTLSYNHKFGKSWDITTNYSYYNNSFSNLGLGTSVKWGPAQIYFITDDILLYFFPNYGRTVYLRFGCNLVWGAKKPKPRVE